MQVPTTTPPSASTAYVAPPSPRVPWGDFYPWFMSTWEQGQHVTMIAPTGWGKTTLATEVLHLRSYLAAFCVKGRDETMEKLIRDLRMMRVKRWTPDVADRLALWPDIRGVGKDHRAHQRAVFLDALNGIFQAGGWCAFFDEVVYLCEVLGLEDELKFLLNQGRSSYITVVACTQRPAFIPLAFYDQATHLFIGRDQDHRNVRRLAELTGNAAAVVRDEVQTLNKWEYLYVNRDTGYRARTKVEV